LCHWRCAVDSDWRTLDGVVLGADVVVPGGQSLTVKNGLELNSVLRIQSGIMQGVTLL